MQGWEYQMHIARTARFTTNKKGQEVLDNSELASARTIWDAPWRDKTSFQIIQEMGREGWEMVSALPVVGAEQLNSSLYGATYTNEILFVFKRPLEE